MFCSSCGHDLSGVKGNFCPNCGKSPEKNNVSTQETQTNIITNPEVNLKRGLYKSVASMIVAILLVTMNYGWITTSKQNVYNHPLAWGNFANVIIQNWHLSQPRVFGGDINNVINDGGMLTFTIISVMTWAVTIISISGFITFIFLLCKGSNKAGLIGQISMLITLLISSFYAIYIIAIIGEEGIQVSFNGWSSILYSNSVPSIWVYLTIVISFLGLIYISKFKKHINGV
ncbi:MAG: zinc ribbon domain-containing protein [Defluviitaleaceae bacterium]|nr:zinc ribbon domain-containing protein [Defluviitaleaceae bacterium]